jgi:hypothetical protein
MEPIPDDIQKQFNAVLEQKAVPSSLRDDYRKWLRYYLDFGLTLEYTRLELSCLFVLKCPS